MSALLSYRVRFVKHACTTHAYDTLLDESVLSQSSVYRVLEPCVSAHDLLDSRNTRSTVRALFSLLLCAVLISQGQ